MEETMIQGILLVFSGMGIILLGIHHIVISKNPRPTPDQTLAKPNEALIEHSSNVLEGCKRLANVYFEIGLRAYEMDKDNPRKSWLDKYGDTEPYLEPVYDRNKK